MGEIKKINLRLIDKLSLISGIIDHDTDRYPILSCFIDKSFTSKGANYKFGL